VYKPGDKLCKCKSCEFIQLITGKYWSLLDSIRISPQSPIQLTETPLTKFLTETSKNSLSCRLAYL
jgi:hypothetical protein